jgi:uncharacterized phosphosugar-binding protein
MISPSKMYLNTITSLLTKIETEEKDSINRAAEFLAKTISSDKLIHVIGPGGHSNMAVEEVFWRAGGLAPINAILDAGTNLIHGAKRSNYIERTPGYAKSVLDAYGLYKDEVLIIVNAYGLNAMTIDCAIECKKRNIVSIGITSKSFADTVPKNAPQRHPSGMNLYENVDVFINTHLPMGDSVVEIPGLPQKMGPTSTFVNSFTINLLMIRTAEKLIERGIVPPVWTSSNAPGGDQANYEIEQRYIPRIKHLR